VIFVRFVGIGRIDDHHCLNFLVIMLNAIFNITFVFHLYCDGQLNLWRKPEYTEEITDLSQVTDKLYHITDA